VQRHSQIRWITGLALHVALPTLLLAGELFTQWTYYHYRQQLGRRSRSKQLHTITSTLIYLPAAAACFALSASASFATTVAVDAVAFFALSISASIAFLALLVPTSCSEPPSQLPPFQLAAWLKPAAVVSPASSLRFWHPSHAAYQKAGKRAHVRQHSSSARYCCCYCLSKGRTGCYGC